MRAYQRFRSQFGMLLLGLCLFAANSAAQTYSVVSLGTMTQAAPAVVRGPNTAGVAAGGGKLVGSPSGPRTGLVFQSGATPRQITGLPATDDTTIYGLNDNGGFVGASNTATGIRAFSSTVVAGVRELPPLAGDISSIAYALNNAGQAVGLSSGAGGQRAVIWAINGTATPLPVNAGVVSSRATGINDRGDVVGVLGSGSSRRPAVWVSGQLARELPLLGGNVTGEAFAINAQGDTAGYSASPAGARRATVWTANGAVVDIGTFAGGDFSVAFSINNAEEVVGTANIHGGSRAFLWTRSGGLRNLNDLIPASTFVLTQAVGINNVGMIVATGYDVTAQTAGHTHEEAHELPMRVFLLVRAGGVQ